MKTLIYSMKIITSIVFLTVTSIQSHARQFESEIIQKEGKEIKVDTVKIQTSAICGMCKERIEHNLAFEKGVKYVDLDKETKVVTIAYKTDKTDKETLKKAVTKIGYDADEMKADQDAHDRLPACCQKGNTPH